jgi:Sec7-like guanine-nucleotide exchange factor
VLSYSVVLLNTDHYNPQVKRRMTKAEFIKNNREINDGRDLPEELLLSIYDDIASNEIRMKDEVALAMPTAAPGFAGALANVGRDLQREAYVMQSHGMANKTEVSLVEKAKHKVSHSAFARRCSRACCALSVGALRAANSSSALRTLFT